MYYIFQFLFLLHVYLVISFQFTSPFIIPRKFRWSKQQLSNPIILNKDSQSKGSLTVLHSSTTAAVNPSINITSISTSSSTLKIYRLEASIQSNENVLFENVEKPLLLYLPGLDGVGNYSFQALQNLSLLFDIWRLEVATNDRSRFLEISSFVSDFIRQKNQKIILMGESFGGLLACHLAIRNQENISKLILVNPATSFDQTNWPYLGNVISRTGPAFPVVGVATLLATAVEPTQFQRIGRSIVDRINSTESAIYELTNLIESGTTLTNLLPPETLRHRLSKWLQSGTKILQNRYSEISIPSLILVGENDRLLPSSIEGKRLKRILTSAVVDLRIFPNGGHAILDDTIDLLKEIQDSKIFNENLDEYKIKFPSEADIESLDNQFRIFNKIVSPIFLSRNQNGRLNRGLANVPSGVCGRPVLLVGNHQLFGTELYFIVREFIREKQLLIRGLAHPVVFQESEDVSSNGNSAMRQMFEKFGAVKVSPSSYYELLRRNETIMLFPGGASEAFHRKGEDYKLFWPEKTDFVRMATLMDAIIVPFASIGSADSVNILLDRDEILKLPYFGERARQFEESVPSARAGIKDSLLSPLAIPKLPSRFYFLFQQPFDTRTLNSNSKSECNTAYLSIQRQVNEAISTLLRFRDEDPYADFFRRQMYERISKQQAPTSNLYKRDW